MACNTIAKSYFQNWKLMLPNGRIDLHSTGNMSSFLSVRYLSNTKTGEITPAQEAYLIPCSLYTIWLIAIPIRFPPQTLCEFGWNRCTLTSHTTSWFRLWAFMHNSLVSCSSLDVNGTACVLLEIFFIFCTCYVICRSWIDCPLRLCCWCCLLSQTC